MEQLFIRKGKVYTHAYMQGVIIKDRLRVTPANFMTLMNNDDTSPERPEFVDKYFY